jgi:hypothetical protein
MTHDTQGRPWAKLSEIKSGDVLTIDSGFTCMAQGERKLVEIIAGECYVRCNHGMHYLNDSADDGEHLVGFYREKAHDLGTGRSRCA